MESKIFTVQMPAEIIYLILEGLGKLPHERVEIAINNFREILTKPTIEEMQPPETPKDALGPFKDSGVTPLSSAKSKEGAA
jgi:hypothetical protein